MFDRMIALAVHERRTVLVLALLVAAAGTWALSRMPVDVFPDLNRPTVNVLTEAPGLAPEDVELAVTRPLEQALVGASGVERVRSTSGQGLATIAIEFGWGMSLDRARQVVAERLPSVLAQLPPGITPVIGPRSSIMGEVLLIGLESDGTLSPRELRTVADAQLRPRLLSLPGVSQVIPIGGRVEQVVVQVHPARLAALGLGYEDIEHAVATSNQGSSSGVIEAQGEELLVRTMGRINDPSVFGSAAILAKNGIAVPLREVADVGPGDRPPRGDAGVNGRPAVILSIQKQPDASTIALTRAIETALAEVAPTLPGGVTVRPLFRQADFIEAAIHNVEEALRDGALLVAVILLVFLASIRTTLVTLIAIPMSLLISALVLHLAGVGINTMTLGGVAIAIGELVDDAIVDIENVHRRLRENALAAVPRPVSQVVIAASREVRNAIVYATVVVVLVFLPMFALPGIEGRMFIPLGLAYVTSLIASFVVSLTVTPALARMLFGNAGARAQRTPWLVGWLQRRQAGVLGSVLDRPGPVFAVAGILVAAALAMLPFFGHEFLPPFNEGTATISVVATPGISLTESARLGALAESLLLAVPEVKITGRRTGRAELDEHAEGVHNSEIEVDLHASQRSRAEILADCRARLAGIPGVVVNVGQPISHRLDHLLSGVRAQIAIKLFGEDLDALPRAAEAVRDAIADVPGLVDLQIEPLVPVPQLRITPDREALSRWGLHAGDLASATETALGGRVVSQILDGARTIDVVVRADDSARENPDAVAALRVVTPDRQSVALAQVAHVEVTPGPSEIRHENARRRLIVSANIAGRDLEGAVRAIQQRIAERVTLPPGMSVEYGGQFESQRRAMRMVGVLGLVAVLLLFGVLASHFSSAGIALQVLLNIPLALVGATFAVALSGATLSVASLVGFVTLTGIASRNTILMISHYRHLICEEGVPFGRELVLRGSLDRLAPVLMTACTAGLALLPIAWGRGLPGREILEPLARVILGGLVSSTLLDLVVTPAVFLRYGAGAAANWRARHEAPKEAS